MFLDYLVRHSRHGVTVMIDESSLLDRSDNMRLIERIDLWLRFCEFHGAPATVVNLIDPKRYEPDQRSQPAPVESVMSEHIQFALISHTNNGKTTLARTLIGMDVGEVRDAAHVTVLAESHTLIETAQGDTLSLWDTPGFGDSVRLLRRLELSGNPIGWFLREVFDRYRDKPFWLSQQALRTARDAADVVLYLVNSAELPQDAGYLPAEMKILAWLGKPVMVLLNQVGPPRPAAAELAELERWKTHLRQFGIVREVLALDAFARCWVHERVFYEAAGTLIDPARRDGYARLLAVWQADNQRRFGAAMDVLAAVLAAAARDSQTVDPEDKGFVHSAMKVVGLKQSAEQQRQEKAMAALVARLEEQIGESTRELLRLHRLDPGNALKIHARVRDNFKVRAPVDKAQAGLWGRGGVGCGDRPVGRPDGGRPDLRAPAPCWAAWWAR
ncbi:GTPase domain-containing protein [Massilia sp. H-1]|nr:GTPase domain-containing protein [Massilia sp. H-1]